MSSSGKETHKCTLCNKKSIKDGFCVRHLPKKIVVKQVVDPRIQEERMRRINNIREKARYREEMIEREYFRIRDSAPYGDKTELDYFIERVNRQRRAEEEKLERDFDETMRFFESMRSEETNTKRQGYRTDWTQKEKPKPTENPKPEKPKRVGEFESLFVFIDIEPTRDPDSVRRAYKVAAIKLHPDKCSDPNAHEKFIAMKNAYDRIIEIISL